MEILLHYTALVSWLSCVTSALVLLETPISSESSKSLIQSGLSQMSMITTCDGMSASASLKSIM